MKQKKLIVDAHLVEHTDEVLKELLITDSIKGYQRDVLAKTGIYLNFEHDALEKIGSIALAEHKSFIRVCEDMFHDYTYAIRLMGLNEFVIPLAAVDNPPPVYRRIC